MVVAPNPGGTFGNSPRFQLRKTEETMGLLDSVLMGGRPGLGGMGPGGMGLGGLLGAGSRSGGISPMTLALLGTLAYRTLKGKGRLADLLGTAQAGSQAQTQPQQSQQPQPQSSPLANLLSPGALSEGLNRLLQRFEQNGHGDKAQSWVTTGPNKQISPPELEEALGEERIAWLMQQTGLGRQELLAGLSQTLPHAVDQLTPDGRVPSEQEARRLM
jgi:uncharacterized protein YidB (DUF937 family)